MDSQLPSILALVGVLATILANIILGLIKNRSDKQANENDDEGEFQDRLLAAYKALQDKSDKQEERLSKLQDELDQKRSLLRQVIDEKYEYESKIKFIERQLKEKEDYISDMERKVWYRGEIPPKDIIKGS